MNDKLKFYFVLFLFFIFEGCFVCFCLSFFSFLLVCFFREEQNILAMKMNSLWFTKLVSEDLYF